MPPAILGILYLRIHIAGGMLGVVRFVVLSCRHRLGDTAAELLATTVRCNQRHPFAGSSEVGLWSTATGSRPRRFRVEPKANGTGLAPRPWA